MHRIFKWIVSHRKSVMGFFLISLIVSAIAAGGVSVNYNLMDYLPKDAPALVGLNKMQEAFHQSIPSVRVMIPLDSLDEAKEMANSLGAINGVTDVQWLGDFINAKIPLDFFETEAIRTFYKEGHYLYHLTLKSENQMATVAEIRSTAGKDAALDGNTVSVVYAMAHTEEEVKRITLWVIFIVFLILLLTTSSWFEPVLFMLTIGVAIVLNMGTNLLFGQISFLTNAAALVLQLAVSMDYAIFLLHRFSDYRHEGLPVHEAMLAAMDKSFRPILASASTTLFGFGALLLMRYGIGADLGMVLGKSVILSLISVLVLLPVLSMQFSKVIDKTHHKPLTLQFTLLNFLVSKGRLPLIAIFLVVASLGFLAQNENQYLYGISKIYSDPNLSVNQESEAIETIFGKENKMVLLIKEDAQWTSQKNLELSKALKAINGVGPIVTYTDSTGLSIPREFLPEENLNTFVSEGYQRLFISLNTAQEGEMAFRVIEDIEKELSNLNVTYYLIGETPNTKDLKTVVTSDSIRVNTVAAIAIGLVLILTFKGLALPLMLLFIIESAIFINLGVPYLTNQPLFYISYLIIGAVQLGATVDYAILFGSRYLENRTLMGKGDAVPSTIKDTGLSILTSAGIMAVCGFFLGSLSSNQLIGQLGILVGRGALISVALVLTVLPCLLYIFDYWAVKPILSFKSNTKS